MLCARSSRAGSLTRSLVRCVANACAQRKIPKAGTTDARHVPVMLEQVSRLLNCSQGETVVDCTSGLGGHSSSFANAVGTKGHVIGIDADASNVQFSRERLQEFTNVSLFHANFASIGDVVRQWRECHHGKTGALSDNQSTPSNTSDDSVVDVIFADLGLSSPHIDEASRGFSIAKDGPLDMRFDQSKASWLEPVHRYLARADEDMIQDTLFKYSGLGSFHSRNLARAIVAAQDKNGPMWVDSTHKLRDIAVQVINPQRLNQVFQAFRIEANDEMGALRELLADAPRLLRPGGRFGFLSYHSLEDRMVKQAFRELCSPTKDLRTGAVVESAMFVMDKSLRKGMKPSTEEVQTNRRAAPARFRMVTKVD